jgi:hypothetical protein
VFDEVERERNGDQGCGWGFMASFGRRGVGGDGLFDFLLIR